jgi:transketolase
MRRAAAAGAHAQKSWESAFESYQESFPELAAEFPGAMRGELPDGWNRGLPSFETGKPLASRASSGQVLSGLSANIPTLIGGSADLTGSNKTLPKGVKSISRDDFSGRYIHFGIREHGMGGILNGMALHGGLHVYGGTFLVFSDYMRPAIRLAALMGLPVIYVFTHDSIGLGEDGPTHQPVEQLMSLRTIPNLMVFRPADSGETAIAWQVALDSKANPTSLVLTRQGLPTLDPTVLGAVGDAFRGAYILSHAKDPEALLIGTGSEVHIALAAQQILAGRGVSARVISMASWELFESQSDQYKQSIFPADLRARVSIEAGTTLGWDRYVGSEGVSIGLDRFGASAPYQTIYQELGITADAVVEATLRQLG